MRELRRALQPQDALYGAQVARSLSERGFSVCRFAMPSGEAHKTLETWERMLAFLSENGMTRTDAVVALGGGVPGDVAGFAAACYQRGVDLVQIPTTLLAMIDSSVGGKTGVDLGGLKNQVGAFHQPRLVLIDPDALSTLPAATLSDGAAEAVKYGVLGDTELFERLSRGGWTLPDWRKAMPEICRQTRTVPVDARAKGRVLRALADFLRRHFRGTDIVGRLGGDEFVVILLDCGEDIVCRKIEELRAALEELLAYGGHVIAEKKIHGRDMTVGILGDRYLPAVEIIPQSGTYFDYAAKYQAGGSLEVCPADITEDQWRAMGEAALTLHRALGLTVYSRTDFILDGDGNAWCLEINTLPGMTPTSLVPQEAAAVGIDYASLCQRIIEESLRVRKG